MSNIWGEPTSAAEAYRRAGGRRGYNARRKLLRACRRTRVAELFGRYGFFDGASARIARELGVSRSTVCRDRQAILKEMQSPEASWLSFLRRYAAGPDC